MLLRLFGLVLAFATVTLVPQLVSAADFTPDQKAQIETIVRDLQRQNAALTAMEKWLDDTRARRHNAPEEEKAFLQQLQQERQAVDSQQKDLDGYRQELRLERASAECSDASFRQPGRLRQ